jgi:hypothetical protein
MKFANGRLTNFVTTRYLSAMAKMVANCPQLGRLNWKKLRVSGMSGMATS